MPPRTIANWITRATTKTARKPASSLFSPALTRSATGPRLRAAAPGSTDLGRSANPPSESSEIGSGMPGFLEDRIVKVGPDDVLELRVHALRRLAVTLPVYLDDGHALGLESLCNLVALGGDRGSPVLGERDAGGANRGLRVSGQRIELGLARHHHTHVVNLVGRVDRVDDQIGRAH